ncbi:hypothetical protein Rsub_00632 [Raphidocelis subcapitata]|uniref:Uncharacterized protein n=1 Tax=Raphidocelis subcapitata TaxID=307507 RepID=A0A2V0NQU1_9CHLO|nr:hypothetical protein Rsub_00632 [Raphidocelis subcapitata]|eukprot:GBF87920.1 hypothetical protein Rsub_00632 [Raphidocelis subcapitata]
MAPRPQGTDGSDHAYRMVIEQRYQRMADFKHVIVRLIATHVVLALAKAGWTTLGMLEGYAIPVHALGMLLGEAMVVGAYVAARLGTVKESLGALKAFNLLQASVAATHVLSSWGYYTGVNAVPHLYATIVTRRTAGLLSGFSEDFVQQTVQGFELFLDFTLGVFLLLAIKISHDMIKEKMELKKEAANKGAAKRAADASAAPSAAAAEEEPAEGAERRVTAKASMRARRRMA